MKAAKKTAPTQKRSAKPKAPVAKALVLRTCAPDMSSHNGFIWPRSGPVSAPDWKPNPECGNGLHGWLWGQGDFSLKRKERDAVWLVVEVDQDTIVSLGGKVKFPSGTVVFAGFWWDAMAYVRRNRPKEKTLEALADGCSGHAAATGNYGHAAATGNYGHAAATGNYGHAAATGCSGHAAATGNSGHAAATGYYGHAAATGDYGHAAATGNSGHAAATGDYGHAAATGNYGIACALGNNVVVKAGPNGALIATFFCETSRRRRVIVAYVGEDGIEANCEYVVKDGKFAKRTT